MQARTVWQAPVGTLGRLSTQAALRSAILDPVEQRLRALDAPSGPSLVAALRANQAVGLIAEVKRRSPSKGWLDESIDAAHRARQFVDGGATAISVLTEPDDFGGTNQDLLDVRAAVKCPVIRKDFHVAPVQLWEARSLGASAALLIVRALGPDDTPRMADAAREAGIEAVFEVRSEDELQWALDAGAEVIGVNRRNLETLDMETAVLERVLPLIPSRALAVAESGILTPADVETVARLGADAVLVGSFLSRATDVVASVAELCGVTREARRG